MAKYEDEDKTILDEIEIDNFIALEEEGRLDEAEEKIREYIKQFENCTLFVEGILKRIKELGYSGNIIEYEKKQVLDFLCTQCKEEKIDLDRHAMTHWFSEAPSNISDKSRENVYKLCFALKMNVEETEKFFLKSYLSRPFNYKNMHEAVYFWCLYNKRTYQEAKNIISEIESRKEACKYVENVYTEQVGKEIKNISDEKELITFLCNHTYCKEQYHMTATQKIEELLEKCFKYAEKELEYKADFYSELDVGKKLYKDNNGKIEVRRIKEVRLLLQIICEDFSFDTLKQSTFPKFIKKNFPSKQNANIIKRHKAGDDAIRKMLILLGFYEFYAEAIANAKDDMEIDLSEDYETFKMQMDELLLECGYVQMYFRNPYDLFINYCAKTQNPLDTFRNLMDDFNYGKD